MTSFHRLYPIVLSLFTLFLPLLVVADLSSKSRALHKSRYTQTHSLGDSYSFDPRDGWQSINVTNTARNYEKRHNEPQHSDSSQGEKKRPVSEHITGVIESIFKLLKPYGQFEKGVATWYSASLFDKPMELITKRYSGEDLKNPSCWSQTSWSPSVFCNAQRAARFSRAYCDRMNLSLVLLPNMIGSSAPSAFLS